jgi:hypothetical protein
VILVEISAEETTLLRTPDEFELNGAVVTEGASE